jgi:hypothetical protein
MRLLSHPRRHQVRHLARAAAALVLAAVAGLLASAAGV